MFSFRVLVLVLGCLWLTEAATNMLSHGDQLNSSDFLVSQDGAIRFGFRRQDYGRTWDDKQFGYYLSMWYTEDVFNHSIWLANRDDPIADDSGVLIVDDTGLKINRTGGDPIQLFSLQSTSMAINSTGMNLVLLDSGNLVLQGTDVGNGENLVLWQSFDHPTDTFLPEPMRLGFSHGRNLSLTAWLTDSIPASGSFTLKWDPVGNQLVARLRGRILWTTGEGLRDFQKMHPLDPLNMNYNFTYVSNPNEQYVHYTPVIDRFTPEELRKNARLLFDGSLRHSGNQLLLFSLNACDGDSTEYGCERWEGPKCRYKGDKYEVRSIRPTHIDSFDNTLLGNTNLSINDCKDICWDDCNCLGVNVMSDLGCQFLSGPYDEGVLNGQSFQVIIRNRPKKFLLDLMTSDDASDIRELQTGNKGHNINIYTAEMIMSATNGFSPENLLGKGGFGPVFKGTLVDGQEVAIKRLSRGSTQGLVEFKNELILIAKLQHTNLVRLLGFCVQGDEKMLVYEYLPNKSLDFFIFDESKRKLLDWDKRFSIIEGIAQGLLYLHKYSRLRIIHRDLKLSNILLDENMNPKISDFGMARIYKTNEAGTNTNRIVGTYGYMSPEYAMDGIFSEKSDVYSFGVMVLEVVSGRKNRSRFEFDRPLNLVGYTWELWKHGAALELMDPSLSGSSPKQYQVLRCITLGLLCVEDNPSDRPTMSDVISVLNGEMQLPLPKHPAFSTESRIVEENVMDKEMENYSVNGLTMSTMDAR
ncbi:G-type lectin S-receptor-like serine/threonine-protein kinase At4g27290 isoform X2 [Hibiscus syriacus]|uniref:G-type lectin S-receptor-like serine/threonine-protein kinase At4g27290 isoform X2 n=1 Tax=Hibiscus syriacus TaxID=106335 RepID=UPI0019235FB1|nr:G-type lectin S-receptor-like serine/threonine-protein kinase At4g27290 isoform X2 [Hibiscus syriacus]